MPKKDPQRPLRRALSLVVDQAKAENIEFLRSARYGLFQRHGVEGLIDSAQLQLDEAKRMHNERLPNMSQRYMIEAIQLLSMALLGLHHWYHGTKMGYLTKIYKQEELTNA